MIKDIVTDTEALSQKCDPVPPECVHKIVVDLLDTSRHLYDRMAGLAANQIGYPFRAFVLKNAQGRLIPFVNPVFTFRGKGKSYANEGCLSLPGVQTHKARFKKVQLKSDDIRGALADRWFDEEKEFWAPQSKTGIWSFRNFQARVVQHEMDHFEGILI
jgi:peptide deformylase